MLYYLLTLTIGYVIGRIDTIVFILKNGNNEHVSSPNSLLLSEKKEVKKNAVKKSIEIDNSTYVTQIDTDNYIKNFDSLGNETVVSDNVSAAASKLSQLKKK